MSISPISLVAILMLFLSVRRYIKTRLASALMMAVFWALLMIIGLTGIRWMSVPAAVLLAGALYQRFSPTREPKSLLERAAVERERDRREGKSKSEKQGPAGSEDTHEPGQAKTIESFTQVVVDVESELVFGAVPDKRLVIAPGSVGMSFRTRMRAEGEGADEIEGLHFDWRLVDSDGNVWETNLWLLCSLFTNRWHQPSSPESGYVLWSEAPVEWIKAMDQHRIARQLGVYDDCREILHPVIGGVEREIFMKHQGVRIDAAFVENRNRIVVRTSGLRHRVTEIGWDGPESQELDPFAFEMTCEEFMPSHVPCHFFVDWREWLEYREEPEKSPFVFSPTGEAAEANALVCIRQDGQ